MVGDIFVGLVKKGNPTDIGRKFERLKYFQADVFENSGLKRKEFSHLIY